MAVSDQQIRLILEMGNSGKNVEQVRQELDKLTVSAKQAAPALQEVAAGATQAAGVKAPGGGGMLGVSYAFQDFTSVLTGGGGFARALGAITNNFDQLAKAAGATATTAAGLSIAFTGFVAVLPILIPMFKDLWQSIAGGEEGPEALGKGLDTLEKRIDTLKDKLEGIRKGMETTAPEKTMEEFFALQGPDFIGKVAGARAISPAGEKKTPDEVRAESEETAKQYVELNRQAARLGGGPFDEAASWRGAREAQQAARDAAQDRINKANVAAATTLLNRAKGAEGLPEQQAGARAELLAMGRRPGPLGPRFAGEMETVMPEALRAGEREDARMEVQEKRIHEAMEQRDKDAAEERKVNERTEQMIANTRRNAARRDREERARELRAVSPPEGGIRGMIRRQEGQVQGRQAQRQVFEATGGAEGGGIQVPPEQAMAIVKQRQQDLIRQQNDFFGNVMNFADGMGQEAAMFQEANKQFRQMQTTQRNQGHG